MQLSSAAAAARGGLRHTLRLRVAVPSKAKDVMLQSRLSAVQNKHASAQPERLMKLCASPQSLSEDNTPQLGPATTPPPPRYPRRSRTSLGAVKLPPPQTIAGYYVFQSNRNSFTHVPILPPILLPSFKRARVL